MITAVGKRIIVEPIDLSPKKESFLILPNQKQPCTVLVVAVGSEVDKNIDIGMVLYLPDDCGIPVEINGETYLSIVENQVLAAWKDK